MKFFCSILIIAPLLAAVSLKPARETYVLDKKESVVTWKCAMQFVPQNQHHGYVDISRGELMIEKDRLVGGTVEVDMNTIVDERHESDNNLVDHLKSPDFFDAEKFPISAFKITAIAPAKGDSVGVTGNLTIKDVTQAVTFPALVKVDAGVVNAHGKLIIDRTKWDVRYGSGMFFSSLANETISDEIVFDLKIVARKK